MMGLITERGSADGYAAVTVPLAPGEAVGSGAAMLHRRSALPSRRSVLYLHCQPDTFVPEDLASWFTERGFHFWVADLRPPDGERGRARRGRRGRAGRFAALDAAFRYLREAEGMDMIIMTADAAGAVTAAEWCDARRDAACADALILSGPALGRRLRRGLDIACPVLVLSPAERDAGGRAPRSRQDAAIKLGPHVTWLRLRSGLGGHSPGEPGSEEAAQAADADRRQFFDEMGRWLGAYMYGHVRDQLL
jgi:hypothetical protein